MRGLPATRLTQLYPNSWIRGTDYAIWRRIRLIPFAVTLLDDGEPRKDPNMEEKLTTELPGILAWAVAGCLEWQKVGLKAPFAVTEATANYQAEMDVLAAWMTDRCILGKPYQAKASDLYQSYENWCETNGESIKPQRSFGMALTEKGLSREKRRNGHWWRGIGIMRTEEEDD